MKAGTTLGIVALVGAAVLGCGLERGTSGSSASTTTAGGSATSRTTARPPAPDPESPFACTSDRDCPGLACGPCVPGEVVKHRDVMINCYRNVCPGTSAVCRGGVCVVR